MIIGLDQFGFETLARGVEGDAPPVPEAKLWTEICKTQSTWIELEATPSDITRCDDAS
jgi:hypothetical protein